MRLRCSICHIVICFEFSLQRFFQFAWVFHFVVALRVGGMSVGVECVRWHVNECVRDIGSKWGDCGSEMCAMACERVCVCCFHCKRAGSSSQLLAGWTNHPFHLCTRVNKLAIYCGIKLRDVCWNSGKIAKFDSQNISILEACNEDRVMMHITKC